MGLGNGWLGCPGLYSGIPVEDLSGAEYNPRKISEESFARLLQSLRELGFLLPVIATTGGRIVAGHQRVRAARILGIRHVPAYLVRECSMADEVRFNQNHNGSDHEVPARLDGGLSLGVSFVKPSQVHAELPSKGANLRHVLCKMLLSFGPFGGVVASQSGEILKGSDYAVACRLMWLPIRVHTISDSLVARARDLLGGDFGEFDYSHLEKKPWVQTYAQMARDGGERVSPAYLWMLREGVDFADVLDFGCGRGQLSGRFGVTGWEPFPRVVGGGNIHDGERVDNSFRELEARLRRGRFGAVLADYVLNSVQTREAHQDVVSTVMQLCRPGGLVLLSGRHPIRSGGLMSASRSTEEKIGYYDRDGFTMLWRGGGWFFQKVHTDEEVWELAGLGDLVHHERTTCVWLLVIRKTREVGDEAAVHREFSLPTSKGPLPYGDRVVEALRQAKRLEGL